MENPNKVRTLLRQIVINTETKIKELAVTELNNKARKATLDRYIITIIYKSMDALKFNFVERWIVEHYVVPYVDDITQYIYVLLKANILKDKKDKK